MNRNLGILDDVAPRQVLEQPVLAPCIQNSAHDYTYNSTTALQIGHVTLVNRKSLIVNFAEHSLQSAYF